MAGSLVTPLGIATLALLAERPMHPYEMYQTLIQRSEDHVVKVRPGSLYHAVERLARDGLVRSVGTEREGNRPERTTYEITEGGQLALSERVSEIIGTPVNEYPEFPVAIGEAHNLPTETVAQLLRNRLTLLRANLTFIQEGLEDLRGRGLPREFFLDTEYIEAVTAVEAEWVEKLIADLESGDLTWSVDKPGTAAAAGSGSAPGRRLDDQDQ
jgi:DNA-binding PadR family transcriptional regulator